MSSSKLFASNWLGTLVGSTVVSVRSIRSGMVASWLRRGVDDEVNTGAGRSKAEGG